MVVLRDELYTSPLLWYLPKHPDPYLNRARAGWLLGGKAFFFRGEGWAGVLRAGVTYAYPHPKYLGQLFFSPYV